MDLDLLYKIQQAPIQLAESIIEALFRIKILATSEPSQELDC